MKKPEKHVDVIFTKSIYINKTEKRTHSAGVAKLPIRDAVLPLYLRNVSM